MNIPDIIKIDVPIEVSNMEYKFIVENLSGLVFHRRDDEGTCWVKPAHGAAVRILGDLFNKSRHA